MAARDWGTAVACFEACCAIEPGSKVYLLARGQAFDAAGRAGQPALVFARQRQGQLRGEDVGLSGHGHARSGP